MKNLMRMIILNFERVTIKFEPNALGLEIQTFYDKRFCISRSTIASLYIYIYYLVLVFFIGQIKAWHLHSS
jgi:hypothetical protein